ncbi:MAG TPA: hypothetical protein P5294_02655 [Smithellaceae bacterium]|nr:hypothetical protein [Smithellaceae bacterium]HRS88112.1 hypothetical protein [Smithellaceae bacterium]HRV25414.1 hypothetical protein [Smithellaceae bacterium]
MARFFNENQLPLAARAFADAEKLVSGYFRVSENKFKQNRYDVKTLAYLDEHEIKDGAFAHLCKYTYQKPEGLAQRNEYGFDFYRVCLQDNNILDAVQRANPFIKLSPLMLYIAAHELIHVLRFASGEIDFHAAEEEKEKEETIVHNLTKNTLQAARHKDMDLVLECFSNNFKILDI